jgi:hypothetical protein
MKKVIMLFTLSILAVLVSAQRPTKFYKAGDTFSVRELINSNKNYDSTFLMAPQTFDVTGTNLTCGDSLGAWRYSATKNLFLFGTSEYYGRYAQQFTAPYAGRIDSVLVLVAVYTKSTAGKTMNLRIHNVDATHKGPVTTPAVATATPWNTVQIYNASSWPVYKFASPVTFTQGQEFFIALSMPDPSSGDSVSLIHMNPGLTLANCLTVTDSTVWGYSGATPYAWGNCAREWGFAGTLEIGIIPYFTFTMVTTGLQDENCPSFSIFPNPTSNDINITGAGNNADVVMTNALGQVVYKNVISDKVTISTEAMSKGIYFVKVNAKVGKVIIEK